MRKKNFSGVANLIKSLRSNEILDASKYIYAYFNKNTNISADDFWHFAAVVSSVNWLVILFSAMKQN